MRAAVLALAVSLSLCACKEEPQTVEGEVSADGTEQDTPTEDSKAEEDMPDDTDRTDLTEEDIAPDDDSEPDTPDDVDQELAEDATDEDASDAGACDCPTPAKRWVLVDGDGSDVDAVVQPGVFTLIETGTWPTKAPLLSAHSSTACVGIFDLEGQPLHWAQYSLTTGAMADCYPDNLDQARYRLAADCSGPAYSPTYGIFFAKSDGKMLVSSGDADILLPTTYYTVDADGSCSPPRENTSNLNFWALKDIPSTFPTQLPDPPYVLDYR